MMKVLTSFLTISSLFAINSQVLAKTNDVQTSVSGMAYVFQGENPPVPNATVCVLEAPNNKCVTTDEKGLYAIDITLSSQRTTPVTVEFSAEGYKTMRSKTLLLTPENYQTYENSVLRSTMHLQTISNQVFTIYKLLIGMEANTFLFNQMCNVAGTLSSRSKFEHWYYDETTQSYIPNYESFVTDDVHGFGGANIGLFQEDEAGNWVEITSHGPIYTNADVMPDGALTETSEDGGFFFYNLSPGIYHVVATDNGSFHDGDPIDFNGPATVKCGMDLAPPVGTFVNIGPAQMHALQYLPDPWY